MTGRAHDPGAATSRPPPLHSRLGQGGLAAPLAAQHGSGHNHNHTVTDRSGAAPPSTTRGLEGRLAQAQSGGGAAWLAVWACSRGSVGCGAITLGRKSGTACAKENSFVRTDSTAAAAAAAPRQRRWGWGKRVGRPPPSRVAVTKRAPCKRALLQGRGHICPGPAGQPQCAGAGRAGRARGPAPRATLGYPGPGPGGQPGQAALHQRTISAGGWLGPRTRGRPRPGRQPGRAAAARLCRGGGGATQRLTR